MTQGSSRSKHAKQTGQDRRKKTRNNVEVTGLQSYFPGSTVLPPNEALRRLLLSVDKHTIIHVVLNWIHEAKFASNLELLAPQLSVKSDNENKTSAHRATEARTHRKTDLDLIDVHEEQRARSLDELELLWCTNVTDSQWGRLKIVERILEVDWPRGLTFAMAATFVFESMRASPLSRQWIAVHLDYGDDEETRIMMGEKGAGAARERLYETITPEQLKERFSAELKHFCAHSIGLDKPIKRLPIRSRMYAALQPLPVDWTRSFTHLRIINTQSPADVCAKGLHVLHIPHTPWFLISGRLGGFVTDLREMALNALAHSLGARKMRQPSRSDAKLLSKEKMGELKGRDACALRDVILSEKYVQDRDSTAGRIPGGKGRAMRRGDAEEGPLVHAEKRTRDDATGLYEECALREQGRQPSTPHDEDFLPAQHPSERLWLSKYARAKKRQQRREARELFGGLSDGKRDVRGQKDGGLPRLEQIRYDLHLPFPTLQGYGALSDRSVQRHAIQLRLDGAHVLAGLRKLVDAGLDDITSDSRREGGSSVELHAGLPSWLVEARGTKICVGQTTREDEEDAEMDLEEASSE